MKRLIRNATVQSRTTVAAGLPAHVRRLAAPVVRYIDMLVFDHLFIRVVFPNRHRLSDRAWRSAQPLPHQIKHLKKLGIRTIINLRGNQGTSTYRLQSAACRAAGLNLVDYRLRSRAAPSIDEIKGLKKLLDEVEYPILLHCKSGSDRAGLASALYLHLAENMPIDQARQALSLRYGHIRQADTGILDEVFDRYLADSANQPIDFMTWLETIYDADAIARDFHASGWANRLVNGILRRE